MQPNLFINNAKRLLEWNREKLTNQANLSLEDLDELFARKFVVRANERTYNANHQSYFDFLNKFRSDIKAIDYQVQEYINDQSTVVMPLTATVARLNGKVDVFDAILLIKFNESGQIVHWQEVYSIR